MAKYSTSVRGQTIFHDELVRCCRVPLRQVPQRRAHFHEGRPTTIQPKSKSVAQAPTESRLPPGDRAGGPTAADGASRRPQRLGTNCGRWFAATPHASTEDAAWRRTCCGIFKEWLQGSFLLLAARAGWAQSDRRRDTRSRR